MTMEVGGGWEAGDRGQGEERGSRMARLARVLQT